MPGSIMGLAGSLGGQPPFTPLRPHPSSHIGRRDVKGWVGGDPPSHPSEGVGEGGTPLHTLYPCELPGGRPLCEASPLHP
jgi:hypothetical protein